MAGRTPGGGSAPGREAQASSALQLQRPHWPRDWGKEGGGFLEFDRTAPEWPRSDIPRLWRLGVSECQLQNFLFQPGHLQGEKLRPCDGRELF